MECTCFLNCWSHFRERIANFVCFKFLNLSFVFFCPNFPPAFIQLIFIVFKTKQPSSQNQSLKTHSYSILSNIHKFQLTNINNNRVKKLCVLDRGVGRNTCSKKERRRQIWTCFYLSLAPSFWNQMDGLRVRFYPRSSSPNQIGNFLCSSFGV